MSSISFKSLAVAVPRDPKIGAVKVDDYGYTKMLIGAIGAFNSKGEYYEATKEVRQLFMGSSVLQMQIAENSLYGENGHPDLTGLDEPTAMSRFLSIREPNVCTHFRAIYLDPEYYRTSSTMQAGEIAVIGELCPAGDKREVVAEAFNNPYANLSYSIRCITQPKLINGRVHRAIKSIITFDKVWMGGIKHSTKRNAALLPTSEARIIDTIENYGLEADINSLGDLVTSMQNNPSKFSAESTALAKGVFTEIYSHLEHGNKLPNRLENTLSVCNYLI